VGASSMEGMLALRVVVVKGESDEYPRPDSSC
jgi:hypothetical protein